MKKIKYKMTLFIGALMTLPFMQMATQIGKTGMKWDSKLKEEFMSTLTFNDFLLCVGILVLLLFILLIYENLDSNAVGE